MHDGLIFLNGDDGLLVELSTTFRRKTCGGMNADFVYTIINDRFTVGINTPDGVITSQLFGSYNASNIAVACLVGLNFGLNFDEIKRGVENYIPSNNRSQTVVTEDNTVLLDAYNANPSSMEAAVRNFSQMELTNKVLVLGEMYELGDDSDSEHRKIISLCENLNLENVYYVGNWPREGAVFENAKHLKEYFNEKPLKGCHILIKGSRGVKLEQLVTVF